jgi:transposase-like protein
MPTRHQGRRGQGAQRRLAALPRALHAHNALAHAGKSGRRVVSTFIATAFAQDDAEAATTQWRKVADQLRPKLPKLATFLDEAETDVLGYMTFPPQHRTKLHSTNPIERLNGEIKRRTDVVGIFPMGTASSASSARSCSNKTMNGQSNVPATDTGNNRAIER